MSLIRSFTVYTFKRKNFFLCYTEHSTTKGDAQKSKRLCYVGDFNEKDLESPENARIFLSAVKQQKALYEKRIISLGHKNRRLQEKVASLTKEVEELKGKSTRPVLSDSNSIVVIEDIIEVCLKYLMKIYGEFIIKAGP